MKKEDIAPVLFMAFFIIAFVGIFFIPMKDIVKPKVRRIAVGKLINAELVPVNILQVKKMRIETEKGIYIIDGIKSFTKGEEITIINGRIKGAWVYGR